MIKGNAVTGDGWGVARSCAQGSTLAARRVGRNAWRRESACSSLMMSRIFCICSKSSSRWKAMPRAAHRVRGGARHRKRVHGARGATDAFGGTPAGDRDEMEPIDLILLDVNMPGMDGFELCRHLRTCLSCPIIFLTARIEDVDQLDGFSAGADDMYSNRSRSRSWAAACAPTLRATSACAGSVLGASASFPR